MLSCHMTCSSGTMSCGLAASCHMTCSSHVMWPRPAMSRDLIQSYHVTRSSHVTWPAPVLSRDLLQPCHVTRYSHVTWPAPVLSCDLLQPCHLSCSSHVTCPAPDAALHDCPGPMEQHLRPRAAWRHPGTTRGSRDLHDRLPLPPQGPRSRGQGAFSVKHLRLYF